MQRAYSCINLKKVDEEQRKIFGTATTPEIDRVGDVIDPLGVTFSNPLVLLHQHDSEKPVGTVKFDKPTKNGITFEAQIPVITEPGPLKDRVDTAWGEIKAGLIRAVSVGFRAIEYAFMDAGGIHYTKSEILELSLVSVPANASAVISQIKSIDAPVLAATGKEPKASDRPVPPGVTGKSQPVKLHSAKEAKNVKTIQEQIAEWEAKRAAKAARQTEIMTKAAEAGATLDAAEGEEHDTIGEDIKQIDKHLERLGEMQKQVLTKAKPVIGDTLEGASRSRTPAIQVLEPKLEKGIGFARFAMLLTASGGNPIIARELAAQHYPNYAPIHGILKLPMGKGGVSLGTLRQLDIMAKAAVAAGTTSDASHHSALVNYQDLAGEFLEFLRPKTILGQFGTGSIPSLTRVPFNIRVPRQTSKATGYWVGEGKPKPVTSFNTEQITLDFTKAANISVITDELLRFGVPSVEALVRNELAKAIIEVIDIAFIDPANAGSANVKPASITNGQNTVASSGDTAAAVRADVQALFSEFIQANLPLSSAVWIMNANLALSLSMMMNDLGQPDFPNITMNGGTFLGIPVIVSQYVPTAVVVLAAASEIYLADDGNVSIAISNEASIEMLDSALQQDAVAGTGASLVSMFQTNSTAIRAEREINWRTRRSNAVAYLTSANWGGTVGSGDI